MTLYESYMINGILPLYEKSDIAILEDQLIPYLMETNELSNEEADLLIEMIDEALASTKEQILKVVSIVESRDILDEAKKKSAKKLWDSSKKSAKRGISFVGKKAKKGYKASSKAVKKVAKNTSKVTKKLVKNTGKSLGNTGKLIAKHPGKAGAIAAAGVGLGVGAAAVYNRFLSKAGRECAGKSGADRSACIAAAKERALKAKLDYIKSNR